MACKFIQGDGFNAFQCNPGESFLNGPDGVEDPNAKKPYADDECRHDRRFERRGLLTCQDCGFVYDEKTFTWVEFRGIDD